MAKKIVDKTEVYPWLRLLEMEVQPLERSPERAQPGRGRGRPANLFPRKAVHITLTDDELKVLDELASGLSARVGRLHRGHLVAFLVFYLHSRLKANLDGSFNLPASVGSLSDLARYLDTPVKGGGSAAPASAAGGEKGR